MRNGRAEDDTGNAGPGGTRPSWTRRGLICVGVIVLLLAGAGVTAKMVFTPGKLSSMVVPRVEDAVGRDVEIETVRLDLFPLPSVRLENFALAAAPGFGEEPALAGDALDVRLALLPLFTGKVRPSTIRLENSTIRYLVAPDGSHSFGGRDSGDEAPDDRAGGGGTSLAVSQFAMDRGTVIYEDRKNGRSARFRVDGSFAVSTGGEDALVISSRGELDLRSLRAVLPDVREDTLRAEEFAVDYDGTVHTGADSLELRRLTLQIDALRLSASGAAWRGDDTPRVDLRVETGRTDLAALRRLAPGLLPADLDARGGVRIAADVRGPLGGEALPEIEGTAEIEDLALAHAGREDFLSGLGGEISFDGRSVRTSGLEGRLLGREARIEGTLDNIEDPRIDARMSGSLDLDRALPVLPIEVPEELVAAGRMDFDARISGPVGEGRTPDIRGDGTLKGFSAAYAGIDGLVKDATASVGLAGDSVRISSFEGTVLDRPMRGRVTVELGDPPAVRGHLTGEVDLETLGRVQRRLSERAGESTDARRPLSGTAAVDVDIRGRPDDLSRLTLQGPVDLRELHYETPALASPLRIPSGTLRFTGDGVETDGLAMTVGKTDLALTVTARRMLPLSRLDDEAGAGGAPTVEFRLRSERIRLDELFAAPAEETGPTYSEVLKAHLSGDRVAGRAPDEIARERFPVPEIPDLVARGRVEVGEFVNPPTRMEELSFDVRIEEGALRVRNIQAGLYGGRFTGDVTAEVGSGDRRSAVRFDVALEDGDAEAFMGRWTEIDRALTGVLDITVDGRTVFDETLLPVTEVTNADGRVMVRDGSLEGMVPMQGVVRTLGVSADRVARFDSVGGPFRVRGGRLELLDWTMQSASPASGRMAGSVGFAGELDLDMELSMPLSMLEGSSLLQATGGGQGLVSRILGGAAGRDEVIDVPVSVTGTMSDPKIGVDQRAFAAGLKRLLGGQEGRGLLQRILGGGQDEDDEDGGGGGLLEEILGGGDDGDDEDGGGRR